MRFFGLEIPSVTREQVLQQLDSIRVIYTPNPEILLMARSDKKYLKILKNADVLLPDGNGLQFVSTLKRFPSRPLRAFFYLPALFTFLFFKAPFKKEIPEIIHGSDFMHSVVDWAELRNKSVFFLGSEPGIAKKTSAIFSRRNKQLDIAGYSHFNPGKAAFELVRDSKAQVVFVAYGAPKQEEWINDFLPKLPNVELIMGVGGSFDFISGKTKRAPRFMRKLGLEWFWRLALNPVKRAGRIYKAFIEFPVISVFFDDLK
ncbi:MAG: N-acetylglucosaminyldiphosphoundecaprenol N-acetyl-beta-D-mannosaminyltransferase [Oceanicoccus sp.]|jgi:N-acetylglucosaminyldiphosphoundecaprenol N-acetyl-beta-D-mannosaminyltransferase